MQRRLRLHRARLLGAVEHGIGEVAERLHVATRTIHRWIKDGDLVVHRVGGVVRIAEGDLRTFLAEHREA